MSLDDFKFIYWMEWAHRMWGRTLGLAFLLPAAFFTARGWVRGPLARRLALLGAAGGGQGLVGWWMVRSGLEEPAEAWETPRVSPVRLAAHLTSAFAIFLTLLYTSFQLTWPGPPPGVVGGPAAAAAVTTLRRAAHPLAGLIALTALSGAFVAGLDAGRAFNTWPEMGGTAFSARRNIGVRAARPAPLPVPRPPSSTTGPWRMRRWRGRPASGWPTAARQACPQPAAAPWPWCPPWRPRRPAWGS